MRELNATLEDRVARAVAERRQAEAALVQAQKIEALGRLTGGVAHDFNNLLTAISAISNCCQSRLPPPDTDGHRLADAAIRSTQRAARLTQQLLAFGRKQTLQLRPVDVNRVDRRHGRDAPPHDRFDHADRNRFRSPICGPPGWTRTSSCSAC